MGSYASVSMLRVWSCKVPASVDSKGSHVESSSTGAAWQVIAARLRNIEKCGRALNTAGRGSVPEMVAIPLCRWVVMRTQRGCRVLQAVVVSSPRHI